MLESRLEFPFDAEDAYNLSIPICSTWKQSKKRILCIFQTVDSRDLRAQAMLGDKATRLCFNNALRWTKSYARTYNENLNETTYAIAPFNWKRHLHLSTGPRKQAETEFAAHCHALIARLKPTHILISGDEAMHALFPTVTHHAYKRGWCHDLTSGDLKVKVVSTLDFSRLLEKDGLHANLLGFW